MTISFKHNHHQILGNNPKEAREGSLEDLQDLHLHRGSKGAQPGHALQEGDQPACGRHQHQHHQVISFSHHHPQGDRPRNDHPPRRHL